MKLYVHDFYMFHWNEAFRAKEDELTFPCSIELLSKQKMLRKWLKKPFTELYRRLQYTRYVE